MPVTNSSLLGMFGTTLVVTTFCHCAKCCTNSSCSGLFCAPLMAAPFLCHLSAMCDANSSLPGTSIAPAMFDNSTMHDTNSTLYSFISASLAAATCSNHQACMYAPSDRWQIGSDRGFPRINMFCSILNEHGSLFVRSGGIVLIASVTSSITCCNDNSRVYSAGKNSYAPFSNHYIF